MADTITLNLISSEKSSKTSPKKGIKHQQFLGKRRFLESRGYLNKRQNKYNNRQEHMSKAQRKQKKHKHQKPPRCFNANVRQSQSPATPNEDALSPPPNYKGSTYVPSLENVRSSLHTSATSTSSAALKSSVHTFSLTSCSTPIGNPTKYVAIDCEMVGAGPKGCISQLARCSIVSYDGDVMFDKFVQPNMPVTDYRSRWSGIRPKDLANATPYTEAKKEILKILQGKVVIGHAIHNDFKSLNYSHPTDLTRDTSRIPLLNLKAGFKEIECASLKRLTKAILNRDIQTGKKGHSSVEDAQATMELYKVVEQQWERSLASKS